MAVASGAEPMPAPPPVEVPPPPPSDPHWEPPDRDALSAMEYVRALESHLSCLMDDMDIPGWKVNPAFHPDVNAFIQAHAENEAFLKKAQALQQNRAKYFATMRAQAEQKAAAPAPEAVPAPMAEPMAPEAAADELAFPGAASLPPPRKPPRSRVQRLLIGIAAVLLLAVGGVFAVSGWWRFTGDSQLQDAVAAIDTSDPGWQWDDLQGKRAAVADEQNSAPQVEIAAQALPPDWPADGPLGKEVRDLAPTTRLTADQHRQLVEALKAATRSLAEARALARYSTGHWPPRPVDDLATPNNWPGASAIDKVGMLLDADTVLLAQDRKFDAALTSARALLVAGRSIGDDPDPAAQLVRWRVQGRACAVLKRILAQGTPSDEALAATQALLDDERTQPLLAQALRGQRAFLHATMDRLASGDTGVLRDDEDAPAVFFSDRASGLQPMEHWLRYGEIRESQAGALRLLTEAVEAAQQPVEKQADRFKDLEGRAKALLADDRWLAGCRARAALTFEASASAFQRSQAELRCALAALGVERYRQKLGEWPESLDDLGILLVKVPADPFDGKPLRLRKQKDGIVVYSVGPGGKDGEISFRLWNVEKRGQAE